MPIKHPSGDNYFAIHVLDVVDALDRKKSPVELFPNGKVMSVEHYCFKTKLLKSKHIFRIPESLYLDALVSDIFKKRVEELNGRFSDWYYVISDDIYQKIHLGRTDIVKENKSETSVDALDDLRKQGIDKPADASATPNPGPALTTP